MYLCRLAGANYIPVADIPAATSWYADLFGLRPYTTKFDDGQKGVELSDSGEVFFVLGPRDSPTNNEIPMLYTSRMDQLRKHLSSRGVIIGEFQWDTQWTRFFEIRDPEGNLIRICDAP